MGNDIKTLCFKLRAGSDTLLDNEGMLAQLVEFFLGLGLLNPI